MSEFKFSPIDILFTWIYYHIFNFFSLSILFGEYAVDQLLSIWSGDVLILEVIARDLGGVAYHLSTWGETSFYFLKFELITSIYFFIFQKYILGIGPITVIHNT